jgi:hypothetical protein
MSSSAAICVLAACAAPMASADETSDEAVAQDELNGNAGVVEDAYTYFGITADLRKCPSPMCGGWFITRLNHSTTRCHDGRPAASCYTPVLDWSSAGLSDVQQSTMLEACGREAGSAGVYAIVRGKFARTNTTPQPGLGRFVVLEAWVGEGDAVATGTFVKVRDNGRRCFVAPCPSLTEVTLNAVQSRDIAGIDWAPAALDDDQLAACVAAMASPDGALVAGDLFPMTGPAGTLPGRTATIGFYRLGATTR